MSLLVHASSQTPLHKLDKLENPVVEPTSHDCLLNPRANHDAERKAKRLRILKISGAAAIGVVAAPAAVVGTIWALGFGAGIGGGIAAGTWAAGFMASYGGAVTAGSACAILQSAGAAGLGTAATAALSAAGLATAGGIATAATAERSKEQPTHTDEMNESQATENMAQSEEMQHSKNSGHSFPRSVK
ncbi:hypothetical protein BDZ88DRAFT_69582 [Geranomyces variabilis]|nr:hypothetical protein BDZ88DRAFT_69582 [Geranomyces variabilis]KAJ3133080.1 hypothetical protein HDU90_006422 [Geranomyces variabilis]